MSAATVTNKFAVRHFRRLTELEATRRISRIAAQAFDFAEALEAIANTCLQVPGVVALEIVPAEAHFWSAPLTVGVRRPQTGSALAEIKSSGRKWGTVRLWFELEPAPVGGATDSPLHFARFIAQQVAALAWQFSFLSERRDLQKQSERLQNIVIKRKAIQRAKALLGHAHQVSDDEAILLLRRYSRDSGRTLHQVADAIIFSDGRKWTASREIRFPARPRANTVRA